MKFNRIVVLQKEPTDMLMKAVSWGMWIIIPVVVVENFMELMLFGENGNLKKKRDNINNTERGVALQEFDSKIVGLRLQNLTVDEVILD